jgi:SAM-dependent methyltransferase
MKKNIKNPDIVWGQLKSLNSNAKSLTNELRPLLINNMEASSLSVIYKVVSKLTKGNKDIRILDFGCGGGAMVTYLRLLGYNNVIGVDVESQTHTHNLNSIHRRMGFSKIIFFSYDGVTLPFDNLSFDIIISQQVLEHVHNVEQYFSECYRVLDYKGEMLLDFPHRLMPFDTHTRMWFVHYFSKPVRGFFYNRYRKGSADYYNNLLNLKVLWFYTNLLKKLNFTFVNITSDRVSSFSYRDNYEGNIVLRSAINNLFKIPLIGKYIKYFLSKFFSATLIVKKTNET